MVGLAGTSYAGKQYNITYKVNGYLPDGNSEEDEQKLLLNELWKQIVIQFSRFPDGLDNDFKNRGI